DNSNLGRIETSLGVRDTFPTSGSPRQPKPTRMLRLCARRDRSQARAHLSPIR
ncbi:hypothetical protein K458DRAFT_262242, partial [Lentithecium fluviatile CBS 122367]